MIRITIHHEGAVQGPFGVDAGEWMVLWREAELQVARADSVGDATRASFCRGLAHAALVRTLRGRGN